MPPVCPARICKGESRISSDRWRRPRVFVTEIVWGALQPLPSCTRLRSAARMLGGAGAGCEKRGVPGALTGALAGAALPTLAGLPTIVNIAAP